MNGVKKRRVIGSSLAAIIVCSWGYLVSCAQDVPVTTKFDIDKVVKELREQILGVLNTSGSIRRENHQVRFHAAVNEDNMLIDLPDAARKFQVTMKGTFEAFEILPTGKHKLAVTEIGEIFGSVGVPLEDVTFRFLFWNYSKESGEKKLQNISCFGISFQSPVNEDPSSFVLWVNPNNGSLYQIVKRDKKGTPQRQLDVISLKRTGEQWRIRTLRLLNYNERERGPSYLDFE